MTFPDINIGKEIDLQMRIKKVSQSELARRIGIAQQNMPRILSKKDIDTKRLRDISIALDFDFFSLYRILEPECKEETKLETHGDASPIQTGGGSLSVTVGEDSRAAGGQASRAGQASPDVLAEKVRSLSALVAEKDERISELKETIADLRAR